MFLSGRRVDGLDQRLSQQDSANRAILEQLMKIQQDFKVWSYTSPRTITRIREHNVGDEYFISM